MNIQKLLKYLEVEPNKIWKKGESRAKGTTLLRKDNGWVYQIIKHDVIYIGEMIEEIVDIFKDKVDNFKIFQKNHMYILKLFLGLKKVCLPSFLLKSILNFYIKSVRKLILICMDCDLIIKSFLFQKTTLNKK